MTKDNPPAIDNQLRGVLASFPGLLLAMLFGSVALERQRSDSDLDIAVAADHALTTAEKMAIIEALAESTGLPIDLIDLKVVAEPLLGQTDTDLQDIASLNQPQPKRPHKQTSSHPCA